MLIKATHFSLGTIATLEPEFTRMLLFPNATEWFTQSKRHRRFNRTVITGYIIGHLLPMASTRAIMGDDVDLTCNSIHTEI